MSEELKRYCKASKHDIAQFAGFEDLAERTLIAQKAKSASKKSIVRFREVLAWHIPNDLRRIVLEDIATGELNAITKSTAIKTYGKALINQCPWFLLADNPHYKTASPMQLYSTKLLDALKLMYHQLSLPIA